MDESIFVTKTFLPDWDIFISKIRPIWDSKNITNHGPLVNELESQLKKYLGVKHLFYISNGTLALQIAIKSLKLKGEIITTPFSYVATTSSIVWENCLPVFADIDPKTLCISPEEVIKAISPNTTAILATHVYGNVCDIEKLVLIAKEHNLKLIFDAAHSFGVKYKNDSVLAYGDVSTLSFHATKIFHTAEGGAIITNNEDLAQTISYMRNFGHNGNEDFFGLGINGKCSELHAALGLSILPQINRIIEMRKEISKTYEAALRNLPISRPLFSNNIEYNYSYFPIIFESEKILKNIQKMLNENNIYPRRYFYPSLNKLNYVIYKKMPVSEEISRKILCLPLHPELSAENVKKICTIISNNL